MADDPLCTRCGERVPPDEVDCPYCARRKQYPLLHREPVLFAAILALVASMWLVTHGVTQAYGHRQDHLARTWYQDGDAALRAGNFSAAISELQTALAYSHDSPSVRLRLAEALATAGHVRQAQAYLRALWDEQPGDGMVNLELARLAASTGNVADSQRYYHGAIYGVWNDDPVSRRRNVRLELVGFLLGRKQLAQAESELIAVAADLPNDPKLLLSVGQMFLQTGDANRALAEFRDVVREEPRNAAAYAGAGQAAFQQQNYTLARQYLQRAVSLDTKDTRSAELLRVSELVLQLDPYRPRIRRDERVRRVLRDFEQTQYRLESCADLKKIDLGAAPPAGPVAVDYAQLIALKPSIDSRSLTADPDLLDRTMDLIFSSQTDAASVCGAGEPADQALVLISRANGGRP